MAYTNNSQPREFVAFNAPLLFDNQGDTTGNIPNVGGTFTFALPGTYLVDLSVSVNTTGIPADEATLVIAYLNGVPLAPIARFDIVTRGPADELLTFGGSFLVTVTAGQQLQIRNESGGSVTRELLGHISIVKIA